MPVPPGLADELDGFLQYRIADLSVDPEAQPWLGRAVVLREAGDARIIGTVGFHAPPDADGRVEVGYRVDEAYRRTGVATEVVRALFDWAAREHGVTRFRASISPDNVASLAIASRFGFRHVGRADRRRRRARARLRARRLDRHDLSRRVPSWPTCPSPTTARPRSTRWPSTPAPSPTS